MERENEDKDSRGPESRQRQPMTRKRKISKYLLLY